MQIGFSEIKLNPFINLSILVLASPSLLYFFHQASDYQKNTSTGMFVIFYMDKSLHRDMNFKYMLFICH